jgi:hypothetical protein
LSARLAYPNKRVRWVVWGRSGLLAPPAATTTPPALALSGDVSAAIGLIGFVFLRLLCFNCLGLVACGAPPTTTPATTTAPAALASIALGRLLGCFGQALLLRSLFLGRRFLGCRFLGCTCFSRSCLGRLLFDRDIGDDVGLCR